MSWNYHDLIEGRISLDWREGVRCDSRTEEIISYENGVAFRQVWHKAECDLCEAMYHLETGPLEAGADAQISIMAQDVMAVTRWVGVHRSGKYHVRALDKFRKDYK